jgi:hypothetical protein
LPTAAVVRSSQATPARRRGQACAGVPRTKTIAFGAALPTPAMLAGVDNTLRLQADAGHLSYDDNQHSRAPKLSAISLKRCPRSV